MNVLVVIFSYNRPNLLRLTTERLRKGGGDFNLFILDDDSTDVGVLNYINECRHSGLAVTMRHHFTGSRSGYHQRASRCAAMRRTAMDIFLESEEYEYLVFKDDDVLTTYEALREAIADFEYLKTTDYAKIGALTLHGICTHKGYQAIDSKVFAELRITGEANVIFSKEALLEVGNHFGPVKGGFGDTQFDALRAAGFRYYDRVWPTYQVQHLGFGPNSSSIHRLERTPVWNLGPYQCTYKRRDLNRVLTVDNFELTRFKLLALKYGAEEAARRYLNPTAGECDDAKK